MKVIDEIVGIIRASGRGERGKENIWKANTVITKLHMWQYHNKAY